MHVIFSNPMKTYVLKACAGLLGAVLLSQCVATPQSRIEKNPQLYSQLGSRDRQMVASGSIREGMNRDAVYLAWGRPDRVSVGTHKGRAVESWTYLGQKPVNTYSMGFGYGGGWGGYPYWGAGRFGYGWGGGIGGWGGYPYWGGGPSVTYIPYTQAVVEFTSGRVTSWMASPR